MTDNPHADRLKNKPGTKDGKWGYDPYSRAMAQIDAIEAADKRKEPCIRTLADLLAAANLEEEEVSLGDITLLDIHAVLQSADKSDKSNGRLGLLAKLKEVGVTRLPHRQALASAACKAKKEGKLHPAKEVEAAAHGKLERGQSRAARIRSADGKHAVGKGVRGEQVETTV